MHHADVIARDRGVERRVQLRAAAPGQSLTELHKIPGLERETQCHIDI